LTNAVLSKVDLAGALLDDADLSGVSLQNTNLEDADLRNVQNWRRIASIEGSNLHGVLNPPDGFLQWAMANGAISQAGALDDLWEQAQAFRSKEEGAQ
jgi:uncharacterized protein YjbI with pentapeptide repeats